MLSSNDKLCLSSYSAICCAVEPMDLTVTREERREQANLNMIYTTIIHSSTTRTVLTWWRHAHTAWCYAYWDYHADASDTPSATAPSRPPRKSRCWFADYENTTIIKVPFNVRNTLIIFSQIKQFSTSIKVIPIIYNTCVKQKCMLQQPIIRCYFDKSCQREIWRI